MLHRRHLSGVGVDGIVGECSASANRRGLDAGGPQGGIGSLGGLRDLDGTHPTHFEWIFAPQTWWMVYSARPGAEGWFGRQFVGAVVGGAWQPVVDGGRAAAYR